ncbi:cytochrome c [Alloacidobacterium dinghuense]|uniref:Cytochrome c n=1 Tax=Alloacidobacterium dinghuense TaxID=2763107 RepID=A0A7G8BDQ6_9BACT|nr:cytochrome c [Alloacidobacterium dinghuense]QNI30676.1 cytochrome c [Alloacidobacterium dinghuense]
MRFDAVWVSVLVMGVFLPVLSAQTAPHSVLTTRDGVYTAEQAQQGKAIYQSQCGMCHGDALEGQGENSPLAGSEFLNRWTDQTVADLFMKTIVMMPAMDPGTVPPKEVAQVLAYILSASKFPTGSKELPSDPQSLEAIHIVKP